LPGSPVHLLVRFFDYLTAPRLTILEHQTVEVWATPKECSIFFQQRRADQRHGYEAALTVFSRGMSGEIVRAALLHDVGKRHAQLGAIGRSIASILILLRLPMMQRMKQYRDHGKIGADELEEIGAPGVAVQFARAHHGKRPESIDEATWSALEDADDPPNAMALVKRPISWLTR
jgi:putative nucleotidyltransferase with HDIG domain